jgi:F0F1-type ATP synthase membrane subunit b/b'
VSTKLERLQEREAALKVRLDQAKTRRQQLEAQAKTRARKAADAINGRADRRMGELMREFNLDFRVGDTAELDVLKIRQVLTMFKETTK